MIKLITVRAGCRRVEWEKEVGMKAPDASSRARAKAAQVSCDGCGRREGTARYPDRDHEVLCPKCAAMYQLGRGAEIHLSSLIEELIPAWAAHWLAAGTNPAYIRDILTDLARALTGDGADGKRLDARVADRIEQVEKLWLAQGELSDPETLPAPGQVS